MIIEDVGAGETSPLIDRGILQQQIDAVVEIANSYQRRKITTLNVVGAGTTEERVLNVRAAFERKLPRLKKLEVTDKPLTVVAYGPSLKNSLPEIYKVASEGGVIMTVSGAHDYLISNGIIPDYHAEMDLRERKAEFVKNSHADVHYLIASVCHPKMFDNLEGRTVSMWHLSELDETNRIIKDNDPTGLFHPSFQCIGLNALILGQTLGYREFHIHGMDCSYDGEESHAGFHNGTNGDDRRVRVWCDDRQFVTRPEWIQYARNFIYKMVPNMTGCSFRVYGEGLMQQMLRVGLKEAA